MRINRQVLVIDNWDDFIKNAEQYRDENGIISIEKAAQFELDWRIENREVDEKCYVIYSGREELSDD